MDEQFLFPIVRRVYASTIASHLVSVMPLGMTEKELKERERNYEISKRNDKINRILNRIKRGN